MSNIRAIGKEILPPYHSGFFKTRDGRVAFATRQDCGDKLLGKIGERGKPTSWWKDGKIHARHLAESPHDLIEHIPDCIGYDHFDLFPKVGDWVEVVKPDNAREHGWLPHLDEFIGARYQVAKVEGDVLSCKGCRYNFMSKWVRLVDKPLGMSAFGEVVKEIHSAVDKYPTWPTDPLHALAVLGEEFGELTKDVLQCVYEPQKTDIKNLRKEAVQTAAMAIRFLASIDSYEFCKARQHHQKSLLIEEDYVDERNTPAIGILYERMGGRMKSFQKGGAKCISQ